MPFDEPRQAESATRTTIFVRARNGQTFAALNVADRIRVSATGSFVAAQNSFEAERERCRRAMLRVEQDAESTGAISLILDSINRKEAATGPGIDLCIPISGGGELFGYVRAGSIRFHTGLPPSHPAVEQLARLLESVTRASVQVLDRVE